MSIICVRKTFDLDLTGNINKSETSEYLGVISINKNTRSTTLEKFGIQIL